MSATNCFLHDLSAVPSLTQRSDRYVTRTKRGHEFERKQAGGMEGIEGGEKREKIYNFILMKNKVSLKMKAVSCMGLETG